MSQAIDREELKQLLEELGARLYDSDDFVGTLTLTCKGEDGQELTVKVTSREVDQGGGMGNTIVYDDEEDRGEQPTLL